jgi:hypothetical protein
MVSIRSEHIIRTSFVACSRVHYTFTTRPLYVSYCTVNRSSYHNEHCETEDTTLLQTQRNDGGAGLLTHIMVCWLVDLLTYRQCNVDGVGLLTYVV